MTTFFSANSTVSLTSYLDQDPKSICLPGVARSGVVAYLMCGMWPSVAVLTTVLTGKYVLHVGNILLEFNTIAY